MDIRQQSQYKRSGQALYLICTPKSGHEIKNVHFFVLPDIIKGNNSMSKRIFSGEEIKEISGNENVARCSERSITYRKEFKIQAVKLHEEGMTSQEIFRQAGFSLNALGRKTPKECLERWSKTARKKGLEALSEARGTHGRGGRKPKPKDASDADKIKRLEAEVCHHQEAEKCESVCRGACFPKRILRMAQAC